MGRTLGIAVIGQAPRDEIAAMFMRHLPAGTRVVLRGCLDALSQNEIDARPPIDDADALYSRLPNGLDVKLSKRHVVEHAPETLALLRRDGADALLFNCVGEFPPIPGDAGVVFPSRLLDAVATSLLPRGRVGLLVPIEEQVGVLSRKWSRPGIEVAAEVLAPSADAGDARRAADALRRGRPDLIVLDCMSYTLETKHWVSGVTGTATLLAISVASRVLGELLE
jgi:protein AroM